MIWQIDVINIVEVEKLKFGYYTTDIYSEFQWAAVLSSEKADSIATHLLEAMPIMGVQVQINTHNAPAYTSTKMKQDFAYYNIKHIITMSQNL